MRTKTLPYTFIAVLQHTFSFLKKTAWSCTLHIISHIRHLRQNSNFRAPAMIHFNLQPYLPFLNKFSAHERWRMNDCQPRASVPLLQAVEQARGDTEVNPGMDSAHKRIFFLMLGQRRHVLVMLMSSSGQTPTDIRICKLTVHNCVFLCLQSCIVCNIFVIFSLQLVPSNTQLQCNDFKLSVFFLICSEEFSS